MAQVNYKRLNRYPRIGLALSGGGARGIAHIGVIKALEREHIPIDILVGTSMGGVVAAGYAAGLSPDELEREANKLARLRRLLSIVDPGLPNAGLMRGQRLHDYFETRLGNRTFADLQRTLSLVSVDLNTGQEVIITEGPIALAMRATTAVPGLFAPVEIDGMRLVDGGVLNNLPVDVPRKMGADFVIAVDVEPDPNEPLYNLEEGYRWLPNGLARTVVVIDEATRLMIRVLKEAKLRQYPPDVIIRPSLPPGINVLVGYNRVSELIAAGEGAAEAIMPEIRRFLQKASPSSVMSEAAHAHNAQYKIQSEQSTGNLD
ncbi:MAG: patatin [Anaerolineales bacterium]|nr:patatin [Anaerolineales bacterium]